MLHAGRAGVPVRRIRPAVWAVIVVAAAAAVIPVGVLLASRIHRVTPVAVQPPLPLPPEPVTPEILQAREFRKQAADWCAHKATDRCSDSLDYAKNLDPAGETSPEVQALRRQIHQHDLHPGPVYDEKETGWDPKFLPKQ